MPRQPHSDTPPLRLLERRAPRIAPAAVAPARPAPVERLSGWLRRLVPLAR